MNLVKHMKLSDGHAPVANASNTDVNTTILDMSGWDGVVFIVPIEDSAATGVAKLSVEGNSANADSGMTAITGASATKTSAVNDDINNLLLIVDVYRPQTRYVQGVITSTTANIAFGTAIAILYQGNKAPVTADATIAQQTSVVGS